MAPKGGGAGITAVCDIVERVEIVPIGRGSRAHKLVLRGREEVVLALGNVGPSLVPGVRAGEECMGRKGGNLSYGGHNNNNNSDDDDDDDDVVRGSCCICAKNLHSAAFFPYPGIKVIL